MKPICSAITLIAVAIASVSALMAHPAPEPTRTAPVSFGGTPPPNPYAEDLAARLVAYFPCASDPWSADNPNHLSFGLERRRGWQRFAHTYVLPAVEDLGYRRVLFHLPLGKPTGQSPYEHHYRETGEYDPKLDEWHMGLDQVDHLRRTGQEHVLDDMCAAFDMIHAAAPDIEIIVYVGSYDTEDRRRFEAGQGAQTYLLWLESLAPFIEREYVSIVFDNLVEKDEDHPNARLAQMAWWYKASQGRFTGGEARFQKRRGWLNEWSFACVAEEETWHRQGHPGNIPLSNHHGEVIRVLDGHTTDFVGSVYAGDWTAAGARIIADQCTPAVQTVYEFSGIHAYDLAEEFLARAAGNMVGF